MTVSTTNNAALYKRWYTDKRVQDLTYPESRLFALLPKMTNFTGAAMGVAVITDGPVGGRSATFSNAQSNKSSGTEKQFLVTTVKDYSLISIENEALLKARDDKGAFLRMAKFKTDQALKSLVHNLGVGLYSNNGGSRGQVGSTSTTTLTLKDTKDIVNFAVGMVLDSDDTDGTSGAVDGASITVTAIDRSAGTLTGSANWTTSSFFQDDDYIFAKGDFGAGVHGLDAWLPATAPTGGDSFFGVDRSVDTDRLAGIRYDGSNEPIQEALINAEAQAMIAGADPGVVFMHPTEVAKLKLELGAKVEYDVVKSPDRGDISFKSLALMGSRRELRIVADTFCPASVAYMLDMASWTFASVGPAPMIFNAMGHRFQWDSSADSMEIRTGYYGNLWCNAPSHNVRITLPS